MMSDDRDVKNRFVHPEKKDMQVGTNNTTQPTTCGSTQTNESQTTSHHNTTTQHHNTTQNNSRLLLVCSFGPGHSARRRRMHVRRKHTTLASQYRHTTWTHWSGFPWLSLCSILPSNSPSQLHSASCVCHVCVRVSVSVCVWVCVLCAVVCVVVLCVVFDCCV